MTSAQIAATVAAGQPVSYRGRLITRLEDVPTQATIDADTATAATNKSTADALEAEIAATEADLITKRKTLDSLRHRQ